MLLAASVIAIYKIKSFMERIVNLHHKAFLIKINNF